VSEDLASSSATAYEAVKPEVWVFKTLVNTPVCCFSFFLFQGGTAAEADCISWKLRPDPGPMYVCIFVCLMLIGFGSNIVVSVINEDTQ
jgi:hypothetical protein